MRNKNHKASILGVTLIIMGIVLATALTVSTVSIRERKGSIGAGKSSLAYQAADMGVEYVFGILLANQSIAINSISWGGSCSCDPASGVVDCPDEGFRIELKKQDTFDPDPITFSSISCDSTDLVLEVDRIKSVGTDSSKQTQRAVDADVPVPLVP